MGICLGRGTIISIVLVMAVLPQILLLGDSIIEKTKFDLKKPDIIKKDSGVIFLNGRVRGKISGIIDANINGLIKGDINALVESDNIKKLDDELKNKKNESGDNNLW